jgi:hypothetical protein
VRLGLLGALLLARRDVARGLGCAVELVNRERWAPFYLFAGDERFRHLAQYVTRRRPLAVPRQLRRAGPWG